MTTQKIQTCKPAYAPGHFLDHLQEQFDAQAEWRRSKADEYPHDAKRNLEAAEVFDTLAATCKDVSPEWAEAYDELWRDEGRIFLSTEEQLEMLKPVSIYYANAEEFIQELVKRVKRRDCAREQLEE